MVHLIVGALGPPCCACHASADFCRFEAAKVGGRAQEFEFQDKVGCSVIYLVLQGCQTAILRYAHMNYFPNLEQVQRYAKQREL